MTFEIAPMLWGHIDDVLDIESQCFGADAWSADAFWSELSAVPHAKYYIVALVGESVIGYAGLQFIVPESEVLTVAVHPNWQRQGVARALISHLEQEAVTHGCSIVHLEVEDSNTSARAMYARAGYREVGLRPSYYGPGRDAVLMTKNPDEATRLAETTPLDETQQQGGDVHAGE